MKNRQIKITKLSVVLTIIIGLFSNFPLFTQHLSNFVVDNHEQDEKQTITKKISFNGYTNYWQDNYTQWHRYGNLFKTALPDIQLTILQSKIDIAQDIGVPGLLMQEGFLSQLFKSSSFVILDNPTLNELENFSEKGSALVIVDPKSDTGKTLDRKVNKLFKWADKLTSHQFNAIDFKTIKAYYLINGNDTLFVISSSSKKDIEQLLFLIDKTANIVNKYNFYKGWFGVSTMFNSVTCSPGHPLELIGYGMNEGNTWFVFDGSMEYLAKEKYEKWVKDVDLPIVIDFGSNSIYGCEDYNGLQVQDMRTNESWIEFANSKNGYIFKPVYSPDKDNLIYDGFIANEGNKEQIDNEDFPFIHKTGSLNGNLTSSMMVFIDKDKPLTKESLWDAILKRKGIAISEQAKMMGPVEYKNSLQLLYLDKIYLESYFNDNLDIQTKVKGYDLYVTLSNYTSKKITGNLELYTPPSIKIKKNILKQISLNTLESKTIKIPLIPQKEAMGITNPIAISFVWNNNKKKNSGYVRSATCNFN